MSIGERIKGEYKRAQFRTMGNILILWPERKIESNKEKQ